MNTLWSLLKANGEQNWEQSLPTLILAYNTTQHYSTYNATQHYSTCAARHVFFFGQRDKSTSSFKENIKYKLKWPLLCGGAPCAVGNSRKLLLEWNTPPVPPDPPGMEYSDVKGERSQCKSPKGECGTQF